MSTGPVDYFTANHRRWLRYLFVSTLIIGGLMIWIDEELRTKGAQLGMISLQLAGNSQTAKRIVMNEWNFQHRIIAAFGLGLDFLLIASYVPWLFLGCRWSADRWQWHHDSRAKQIRLLAWLAFAAGGCDIVENIVLFDFIHSDGKSPAYPIAFFSAIAKFACIAVVLVGYCSGLVTRGEPKESAAEKKPAQPGNPQVKK